MCSCLNKGMPHLEKETIERHKCRSKEGHKTAGLSEYRVMEVIDKEYKPRHFPISLFLINIFPALMPIAVVHDP